MLIVDAQVHIWGNGPPTVPPHRPVPVFSKDELLAEMDEAGVDAAVLHPPNWDPHGNELAIEAARQHPDRFAILGHFPVDRPESQTRIGTWLSQPGMRGLRFAFLQPEHQAWFSDGTLDWLWPAAERAGIPIALLAAGVIPTVGTIAERHPGLKLAIDHMGRPRPARDAAGFADLPELLTLAKYPNVSVKMTGAPFYSTDPYPYRNIHPFLRQMFDAFGPRRLFWGTDITRMPCPWRQCVTMFTEELPWLAGEDKELIMGRAVCDWLNWHP